MTASVGETASSRFGMLAGDLQRWVARHSGRGSVLLVLGGLVGVLTGVLAWALVEVIDRVQQASFGFGATPGIRIVLVTTIGALVVGLLITYWSDEPAGGGIVEVLRTNAIGGGRFRARVPFAVLVGSGVGLGTGASGGREAPIVLGGGAVGSVVGRWFGLDEDHLRTLVAAGAAAGIGASFNAPIGGMLFAIELILGRLRSHALQVVVIASVAASITARGLVGPELAFAPLETYSLRDARELLGYAVIGLAAVLVGIAFIRGERLGHALFQRWNVWRPLRLAVGGLGVGLLALAVPEVLGSGHQQPPVGGALQPIQAMIDGGFGPGWTAVRVLLVLVAAKLVATLLSVTSGNAVGTLMPTLFAGAALGGAVGHAVVIALPDAGVQPGAFALVGMAAVFAAAARAPLTAILIVFELTGDYGLVLPLMFGAGLATFLADRIEPDGLYLAPLRRAGIEPHEPDAIDVMQSVSVGEVMTVDAPVVRADLPVTELAREFARTGHHGFAVVDADRLIGVVTLQDLARVEAGAEGRLVAADIATRDPITVTASDPVFRALHRMGVSDVGRLPVVDADDPERLVGMLRRTDIVDAYTHAVSAGLSGQHRRERARLRDLSGIHFTEVVVRRGSAADGQTVADIPWPADTIVTSIRRGGSLIVPGGSSTLRARDIITVIGPRDGAATVRDLLTR